MPFKFAISGEVKSVVYDHIPVAHGHSTRLGGVSTGEFASLNLSTSTGDSQSNVDENRTILGQALALEVVPRVRMVHGVAVAEVFPDSSRSELPVADACITRHRGIGLSVTTADCVPLIFFCPQTGAVGVAHAGWRGTLDGIASTTVQAMTEKWGCRPDQLRVAIGPSIQRCCFEVGPEVAREFAAFDGVVSPRRGGVEGKFEIDLHEVNRNWLRLAGINEEHLQCCPLCTACEAELFFSHRRERGKTGRMMTVIQA